MGSGEERSCERFLAGLLRLSKLAAATAPVVSE
jgi:hypothetical protein